LLDREQFGEARKAFNQHYACVPSEKKPLLARVDYREMSANLTENTPKSHFDLGVFCRENGLFEEAAEEFHLAGRDDDWRDAVNMQLNALEQERYVGDLDRALELNEQGRYHEARELIAFLLKRIQGEEMRETAEGISRLVDVSFEQAKQRAPLEAEMKWESFERYWLVDPELALNILDEILRDFSGTPAAEKARQARPKVLSLRLNALEQKPGKKVESGPAVGGADQTFDGPADPETLQREMRRIHQALEMGAES
jgi:tetratricopeptide (TPR) repeat protein